MTPRRFMAACAACGLAGIAAWRFWPVPPPVKVATQPAAAPAPARTPPLHPVVERVLREGPQMPYLKFNYLIKALPLDLAPHDIEALIAFISGPCPPGFQDGEWGSIVNDIEECLTVQTVPSEKVAHALIAIYRDETKIQMQRDYALQHIGGFLLYLIHTQAQGAPASTRESHLSSQFVSFSAFHPLLAELKTAAADSSKPWAGTALNLLDGILRAAEYRQTTIPGFNAESLVALALPVARDASAPLNARLPALQVAARRHSPAARELARDILQSPAPGIMLTQSASAALARLGTADDLPLLQAIAPDRHTAEALHNAIHSIQSRSRPD